MRRKFKLIKTLINDLYIIEPIPRNDERGFFMETYNKADFDKMGLNYNFIQDNHSRSKFGVLRGLHFQTTDEQAKLVRCIRGKVYDVAVDIRPNSETLGKWVGVTLSEENKREFMIPRGFAHGFLTLSDVAEVVYKCDNLHNPAAESGIIYNDPTIAIRWPEIEGPLILSKRDDNWQTLKEFLENSDSGGSLINI